MAKTEFGVNHPLAVSLWAKSLANEAFRKTFIGKYMGADEDSLITEKTDFKRNAGDNITVGLNVQLQGDGVQGDATLEGNEESLEFYDDNLVINQLRHASRTKGKMTEQRVPYDLRKVSRNRVANWFARRMDTAFFNQVCGNTAVNDLRYTGQNAVLAPSANRHIFAGSGNNADQALQAEDTFNLNMIDAMRIRAETASTEDGTGPLVRPIMHDGGEYYVCFLHDYQVNDLRTRDETGQWLDIQQNSLAGADVRKNPIFTGALGIYNGVILHKASRVTTGVNSATGAVIPNVRRAVLCGAQAACVAFGSANSDTRYSWHEELFDYGNQFGVAAGIIWGLKKTRYTPENDSSTNDEDFGVVVGSSWAEAPDGVVRGQRRS